jgi:hypothetical protein
MKKDIIIRIFILFVILVGGILGYQYGGVGSALKAQDEVATEGYYYTGDIWLYPNEYKELSDDLAKRDSSLQTQRSLVVLPETKDGKLHINYEFFSLVYYDYLNGTQDFPTAYNMGFALSTGVAPILIIVVFLFLVVRMLFPTIKETE